jgi:hypothetical protein
MRFSDIPDDVGDPGVGTQFKELFTKYVQHNIPEKSVDAVWREVWLDFDGAYPNDLEPQLLRRIVTWFIAKYSET